MEQFDEYSGRLVIDWGDGTRAWVQRADNQDKRIVEIRRARRDPDFPGFLKFQLPLDQVEDLYASWVQVLRHARGIYLLVRRTTGEQYVGSASGSDGFFGRWLCYQDGHGGNVGMRELMADAAEYDVNILEVAASDATIEEIYERESMWKTKLGTRAVGAQPQLSRLMASTHPSQYEVPKSIVPACPGGISVSSLQPNQSSNYLHLRTRHDDERLPE